jgi:uncharacterized coiled-coil protein SlyX
MDKLEMLVQAGESDRSAASAALHDSSDTMVTFLKFFRVVVADAHIVFVAQCFLKLRYQPRLAVVTETLRAASIDLLHFAIVLIPTFLAFAIAGNCMFGRRLEDFCTVIAAVGTCFKITIENEFKWMELSKEDFYTAMIWTWCFMILIVLLMLNMVLAIIMDVYSDVRLQAGDSETVMENMTFLVRRIWVAREWVPSNVLLERVSEMPRAVSVEEIRAALPELCDYQLDRLLRGCFTKARAVMRIGIHDSYTAHMAAAIKLGLDEVAKDLQSLKEKGWMGKGLEAGSRVHRAFIQDILQSVAAQSHWVNLTEKQVSQLKKQLKDMEEKAQEAKVEPQ